MYGKSDLEDFLAGDSREILADYQVVWSFQVERIWRGRLGGCPLEVPPSHSYPKPTF